MRSLRVVVVGGAIGGVGAAVHRSRSEGVRTSRRGRRGGCGYGRCRRTPPARVPRRTAPGLTTAYGPTRIGCSQMVNRLVSYGPAM
jgi:hypothetical protein